jgi:hypothetical protein
VQHARSGAGLDLWNCKGLVLVSCVLKRSILLGIRVTSSVVLRGLQQGFTRPAETPTPFRIARQASSLPDLQRFFVLIFSA